MQIPLEQSASLTLTADLVVRVRMSNPKKLSQLLEEMGYDDLELTDFAMEKAEEAVKAGATDLAQLPAWKEMPKHLLTFEVETVDVFHISANHPDADGIFQSRMRYGRTE